MQHSFATPEMEARTALSRRYCLFETAVGTCGLAWSARGVTGFAFLESSAAVTEQILRRRSGGVRCDDPPSAIKALIADVQRYFGGAEVDFSSIAVDLSACSDIDRSIYKALRTIGWGRTTTYGELARAVGCPDARDVGQAMAHNRVPVIIPCHRVLAAGNKMGGFSAPGGTATKQKLLALEGVRLGDDAPRLPGL